VLGLWTSCRILPLHKHGIHSFLGRQCGRPSVARGAWCFAYNSLIIEFKGIFMKFKNVAFSISVEKLIFTIFLNVLMLSYKPSNFERATLPYAASLRVNPRL